MGDYFAILAARVTGAADAVRPLIPSRYESASDVPAAEDAVSGIVETDRQVAASPPGRTRDVVNPTARQSEAPPLTGRASEKHEPSPSTGAVHQARTVRAQPSPDAGLEPERPEDITRESKRKQAGLLRENAETELEGSETARIHAHQEIRRATDDATPITPRVRVLEPKPLDDSPRTVTHRRLLLPDDGAPFSRDSGRAGAPPISRQPVASEHGGSVKAAPAVHISIGRIEIQAVLPPANTAPPPRRANSSAVSLDDYLARRNAAHS